MKTKVNNIFRSLLLLCFGCAWNAALADNVVVADANGNQLIYSYTEATGNATFTGVDSYSADASKAGRIIIADQVTDAGDNTHQVTAVGGSLSNRQNLVSVDIPDNITSIGSSAFSNCSNLTSVTIGTGVTTVEGWAFSYCTSLTSLVMRSVNLSSWGSYCFNNTNNIQRMELDMKTIPNDFYNGRQALTELVLGEHVETIGNNAFKQSGLTSLILGENVTSLGASAFQESASLQSVTFNSRLTAIPDYCFQSTGLTSVTIPNDITSIGSNAFQSCHNLASVTIGTGVTTVGGWAFSYCESLTSLVIRSVDLSSWGSNCFYSTNNIQHMELDVKTIPNGFYDGRQALTELVLGTHVETIGNNAFKQSGLTSLILGENVTSIGTCAFQDNASLTSVTFNSKLQTIGESAFHSCDLLTINVPDSVTSIGAYAFYKNEHMTTATIGNGVETVGGYAFERCYALRDITFGTALTSFGSYPFNYDTLSSITFKGATVPSGFSANSDVIIFVPSEYLTTYLENSTTNRYRIVELGSTTDFNVTTTAGGQLQDKVEQLGNVRNVMKLKVSGFINGA